MGIGIDLNGFQTSSGIYTYVIMNSHFLSLIYIIRVVVNIASTYMYMVHGMSCQLDICHKLYIYSVY